MIRQVGLPVDLATDSSQYPRPSVGRLGYVMSGWSSSAARQPVRTLVRSDALERRFCI